MHSPVDLRVSGLEVGDPLTSYLGSGLEVRIALVLYAHQSRSGGGVTGAPNDIGLEALPEASLD